MTLSRRIKLRFTLMTVGVSILVGGLLWGLHALRRDVDVAFDEYREARLIERAMFRVAHAHIILRSDPSGFGEAGDGLTSAIDLLQQFLGFQYAQEPVGLTHEAEEESNVRAALELLRSVCTELTNDPTVKDKTLARVREAIGHLRHTSEMIDRSMIRMQRTASNNMASTIVITGVSCVAVGLLAMAMNLWQYRSVIRPLRRLRDSARRFAKGHLDEHVDVEGDEEFAEVEDEFNRMATELGALHRDLEEKVRTASRELVRSERLASVGYLAAGVAHEINNPLSIISGFAELSLKEMRKMPGSTSVEEIRRALRIICEESFRCKEITEKLLSLSSSGDSPRERISMGQIATDIAIMLQSLRQYRGRKVAVHCNGGAQLDVLGNETELKQVLLNLTINALDAVESGHGTVAVDGVGRNGIVELSVTDNGRGISADELDRVFEPFFTTQRRSPRGGTGLGLSIVHAIVESHGGTITATSDGRGKGSKFIVRLPACTK